MMEMKPEGVYMRSAKRMDCWMEVLVYVFGCRASPPCCEGVALAASAKSPNQALNIGD